METGRVTRRQLLLGAGAGALLSACGGDERATPSVDPTASSDPTASASTPPSQNEITQQVATAAGVTAPLDYTPLIASFEVLTGSGRRFQFGLLDQSQTPLPGADLRVSLVRDADQSVVSGPATPTYHDEGLGQRGIYVIETDIPEPGRHYLVVATADGQHGGVSALNVVTPETSPIPQVGTAFPSVATPTVDDPGDLAELCTREPDCDMHATSVDQALADGTPFVIVIATPKYCQTAICGPVVDVVLGARDDVGRDDVGYIHNEVFTDAGNTPTDIIGALGLPSEPWTFLVGADGTIVDKFDGPVAVDLLAAAITERL